MPFISADYIQYMDDDTCRRFFKTHVSLGSHPETGDYLTVTDTDRSAGTYVLGVQGAGKSGLLESLIAHDIEAGHAVIVIDPHGDLVTHCIAQLPAERLKHTYLLDMEDEAYPFGVNLFATGQLTTSVVQARAVDRLMHIVEVLWADVLSQQHLPRYVRAATIVFLANPGATLVDMHAFLVDGAVRQRMLHHVTDPTVRQFWQSQYEDLSAAERNRRVQPLIGRLESLFMGRSLVRNIVGQRQTTIDFRRAIEAKEIVLIRLPVKTVEQDARLIGTLLMAQIHAAVFSFADAATDKRPGVSLYVDEFQHFATSDFSELFTEGRKFGVRLTIAHQYRAQLPVFLRDATMTARSKVCFQLTPEDSREMAHLFPAPSEGVRPEDIEAHPVEHLLTYGSDMPVVLRFIEMYLRPLQAQKRGNRVEIRDIGVSVFDLLSGSRSPNPRWPDPTPYLNNLLYSVMRTGRPDVPIPAGAVRGFANCGQSFFTQARGLRDRDSLLSPAVRFPPALVVPTHDGGTRWTRAAEDGMEQLYHFIYHLRQLMRYLAVSPIGKPHQASTMDVAKMLSSLPRRAAFVRTGDDVGVVYTNDTPERVSATETARRVQTILQQTRAKYCYPRLAVEQALRGDHANNQQRSNQSFAASVAHELPVSRWEET